MARHKFSQKENKRIWFSLLFCFSRQKNKFVHSFFGRTYRSPICFWFHLTFTDYLPIYKNDPVLMNFNESYLENYDFNGTQLNIFLLLFFDTKSRIWWEIWILNWFLKEQLLKKITGISVKALQRVCLMGKLEELHLAVSDLTYTQLI